MPAPTVEYISPENLRYIWCKFSIRIQEMSTGTAPWNGTIWDEFSEQHQHQKKHHIQCPNLTFMVH